MDVVFVTTWGEEAKCGIATYSMDLTKALRFRDPKLEITVFSEREPITTARTGHEGQHVYPLWNRQHPFEHRFGLSSIVKAIESSKKKPDVVHFQHEFGLFPFSTAFRKVLYGLSHLGIPSIVTLHTVMPSPWFSDFFHEPQEAPYIVHTPDAAALLLSDWQRQSIVIPHGTKKLTGAKHINAASVLNVKGTGPVALCPGFISPSKGIEEIITAHALSKIKQTLVIVGECRNEEYSNDLKRLIQIYGVDDSVHLQEKFLSDDERRLYFSAANYVVLGNSTKDEKAKPMSASGQLHTAMGYGLPVIAKNVPIYRNSHALLYENTDECASLMHVMKNDSAKDWLSKEAIRLADTRSWSTVAEATIDAYKSL